VKIAIRDDDINYFFRPEEIENKCKFVWDICPLSMSVIPFMEGNWIENLNIFTKFGPGIIDMHILEKIKSDSSIYLIGNNSELVQYIKNKIDENKVSLTFHGITHRNHDKITPQFINNYGIGAEFFTNLNLTEKVTEAVSYIEEIFSVKIKVFTPPQNLFNNIGIQSILNNNLNLCMRVPSYKNITTILNLGIEAYSKYIIHKFSFRKFPYPKTLKYKNVKIIEHVPLQPGSDMNEIKAAIDFISNNSGNLVISTHSWGFNHKMSKYNKTMGEVLLELLEYAKQKHNVSFVNLNELFE